MSTIPPLTYVFSNLNNKCMLEHSGSTKDHSHSNVAFVVQIDIMVVMISVLISTTLGKKMCKTWL
jgi:hypothetical protein